jgi:hypothetical protein
MSTAVCLQLLLVPKPKKPKPLWACGFSREQAQVMAGAIETTVSTS